MFQSERPFLKPLGQTEQSPSCVTFRGASEPLLGPSPWPSGICGNWNYMFFLQHVIPYLNKKPSKMMKPNSLLTSPQPTQPPQPVEVSSEPDSYREKSAFVQTCLERPSSSPGLWSPGAQPPRDPKKVAPPSHGWPGDQGYTFLMSVWQAGLQDAHEKLMELMKFVPYS